MIRISLLFVLTYLLAGLSHAATTNSYYDSQQNLLFTIGQSSQLPEWRLATATEIEALFNAAFYQESIGDFRQETVDAVLALGGAGSGFSPPSATCSAGISNCEELVQICMADPANPICSLTEISNGSGQLISPAFKFNGYEFSFIYYMADTDGWLSLLSSPPEMLYEYCGEENGTPCDLPSMLVSEVPLAPSAWFLGAALMGLAGVVRRQ